MSELHTSAPWDLKQFGGPQIAGPGGYAIATMWGAVHADELRGADLANACLIAAAPELLEALVEAEKHFGPFAEITINGAHDPDDVRVVAIIRAAIAKARSGRLSLGEADQPLRQPSRIDHHLHSAADLRHRLSGEAAVIPGKKFRRAMLYGKQDGLCAYCGVQMTTEPGPRFVTLDHVIPLSKGGVDGPDNEVAACHQCNHLKGCMTVEQIRRLADRIEELSAPAPERAPGIPSTSAEPEAGIGSARNQPGAP